MVKRSTNATLVVMNCLRTRPARFVRAREETLRGTTQRNQLHSGQDRVVLTENAGKKARGTVR